MAGNSDPETGEDQLLIALAGGATVKAAAELVGIRTVRPPPHGQGTRSDDRSSRRVNRVRAEL